MINIEIYSSEDSANIAAEVYRNFGRMAQVERTTGILIEDKRTATTVLESGDEAWILYVGE